MRVFLLAGGIITALCLTLSYGNGWAYEVLVTTGVGIGYIILGASPALAKRLPGNLNGPLAQKEASMSVKDRGRIPKGNRNRWKALYGWRSSQGSGKGWRLAARNAAGARSYLKK